MQEDDASVVIYEEDDENELFGNIEVSNCVSDTSLGVSAKPISLNQDAILCIFFYILKLLLLMCLW